jgi:hypothetical protein
MTTKPLSAKELALKEIDQRVAAEIDAGNIGAAEGASLYSDIYLILNRAALESDGQALDALKAKITERRKWLESEYDRNAENAEIRYEVEAHLNELNRIDAWLNHPALDAAASEES